MQTFDRSVNATSMPCTAGTLTRSSYIDKNTSDALRFGLKLGARRLVSDGVCRMACISGSDCSGLLRINSCNNTHVSTSLTDASKLRNTLPTYTRYQLLVLDHTWPSISMQNEKNCLVGG